MRLELGKSYIWLFLVLFVPFVSLGILLPSLGWEHPVYAMLLLPIYMPRQQNSWVKFGSGRSPSVWYRAISMTS
jgi:hypothetical protein